MQKKLGTAIKPKLFDFNDNSEQISHWKIFKVLKFKKQMKNKQTNKNLPPTLPVP